MSAIMKLTKHGAIIPTHTPCLVIANMVDMERVQKCISAPSSNPTLKTVNTVIRGDLIRGQRWDFVKDYQEALCYSSVLNCRGVIVHFGVIKCKSQHPFAVMCNLLRQYGSIDLCSSGVCQHSTLAYA